MLEKEGSHLAENATGVSRLHGRKRTNDCIRNISLKTFVMFDGVRDTVYPIQNNIRKRTNYKTVEREEPESVEV